MTDIADAVTECGDKCRHVGSPWWYASLTRSTWQGPLPTAKHYGPSEYVPLWWGPVVLVQPGDEVVLLPTPIGIVLDEVRPSA